MDAKFIVTDEEKADYLKRLHKAIDDCLEKPDSLKHGLLIVANDETETLSIYTLNMEEEALQPLFRAAKEIVDVHLDTSPDRIIN